MKGSRKLLDIVSLLQIHKDSNGQFGIRKALLIHLGSKFHSDMELD